VVGGGRLVLRVDDPAYGFEILNFWHTPILGAVQAAVPRAGVHELRCELDAGGGSQGHARGQRGSR